MKVNEGGEKEKKLENNTKRNEGTTKLSEVKKGKEKEN